MGKRIYEAVANLPEELITPEIAAAAIEEGNIQLFMFRKFNLPVLICKYRIYGPAPQIC